MFFYTYLVYCVPIDKYYYGVRVAAKVIPTEDLWVKYFTSSKVIKRLREEHGDGAFKVEIRKTFNDANDAIRWEHKVLRRMRVVNDDRWINKSVFNTYSMDKNGGYTQVIADTTKTKMSESHKKYTKMRDPDGNIRFVLKEDRERLESEGWLFGTGLSPKHLKAGQTHPCYGRKRTQEEKDTISRKTKNKPKANGSSHLKRKVVVDGNVYDSIKEAAMKLGIKRTTLNARVKLRPSPNCKYL